MVSYSVLDARNNLSRLIADARSGLEVVITNRGVPVARITPIASADVIGNGRAIVEWIEAHRPPERLRRSPEELEAQIAENRDAWD